MPFILFPILYLIWKIKTGVPIVKVADMDFITNIAEIEADMYVHWTAFTAPDDYNDVLGTMSHHRRTNWRHFGRGW